MTHVIEQYILLPEITFYRYCSVCAKLLAPDRTEHVCSDECRRIRETRPPASGRDE